MDILLLARALVRLISIGELLSAADNSNSFIAIAPGSGDSYPQGTTRWNQVQQIYYQYHEAVAPSNPLCLAEFGGGWLLGWGGKPRGGVGYDVFSEFQF